MRRRAISLTDDLPIPKEPEAILDLINRGLGPGRWYYMFFSRAQADDQDRRGIWHYFCETESGKRFHYTDLDLRDSLSQERLEDAKANHRRKFKDSVYIGVARYVGQVRPRP